jgi:hypothetical protein
MGFSTTNTWPNNPQPNPWQSPSYPNLTPNNQNPYNAISNPSHHHNHPHNHHKHHDYFANKECIIRSATHPTKVLAFHKGWLHSYLVI